MRDLALQLLIVVEPLDNTGSRAAVGDGLRLAARELTNRVLAFVAIHTHDCFGREHIVEQHARGVDAHPRRAGCAEPGLDHRIDTRNYDAEAGAPSGRWVINHGRSCWNYCREKSLPSTLRNETRPAGSNKTTSIRNYELRYHAQ
jgi:hypothetical protein